MVMVADYSSGKIYKIISPSCEEVYIGSTAKDRLSQRMAGHRSDYRKWLEGKMNYVSSYELIQHGDAVIVLLEKYPCSCRDELRAREQHWIGKYPNCLYINRAYVSPEDMKKERKEYYDQNRERIVRRSRDYYYGNLEEVKAKMRDYRKEHKEEISAKSKERYQQERDKVRQEQAMYYQKTREERLKYAEKYRKEHPDLLQRQGKLYRAKNKERITKRRKEKAECSCGTVFLYDTKARHFRTLRHSSWVTAHPDQIVMLFREG